MRYPGKTVVVMVLFLFHFSSIWAQHRCGTDLQMNDLLLKNPALEREMEESFRQFRLGQQLRSNDDTTCPIVIPVHVIILHPPGEDVGEGANLTTERILSQIEVLNQDFGRYNADRILTPSIFSAENTGIQFCMASIDPNGNHTDGITRYASVEPYDIGETTDVKSVRTAIKRETEWDPDKYLNIWVSPTITLLGFAKVPTRTRIPDLEDDGVSVFTDAFGGPGYATEPFYDLGRTLTHEVGHYLGLNHIWRVVGCSLDDGIDDTPRQHSPSSGCPVHPSPSCGNDGDMFMNYMDYTDDVCMNAFTAGQGAYMREILHTSRASLLDAAYLACGNSLSVELLVNEIQNASCNGTDDGYFSVEICGTNDLDLIYEINGEINIQGTIFSNLTAGMYTISAKNSANVELASLELELSEPDAIEFDIQSVVDASCYGNNDGSFTLNASQNNSSTNSFTYYLNGTGPFSTGDFDQLFAGQYEVLVFNESGCNSSIVIEVNEPPVLLLEMVEIGLPTCFNESNGYIEVNGTGGYGVFRYSIDGGEFQENNTFTGLAHGIYSIAVSDGICLSELEVEIPATEELFINVLPINEISCFGYSDGSAELIPTGGIGPYEFSFNSGDWTSENTLSNLSSGTYDVVVRDDTGCTATSSFTLAQPDELSITDVHISNLICAGDQTGIITLSVEGGTGELRYYINDVENTIPEFTGLSEGIYNIRVVDENTCQLTSDFQIETEQELTLQIEKLKTPDCFDSSDGIVRISSAGGSGNYQYSLDGIHFQTSPDFEGLAAGRYIFYTSDGNECLAAKPYVLLPPDPIRFTEIDMVAPSCNGQADGKLSFNITGNVGEYSIEVNGQMVNSQSLSELRAGNYYIKITDEKSCTKDTVFILPSKNGLYPQLIEISPTNCPLNEIGSISVRGLGGTGAITYTLNDRMNDTGNFTNLPGGIYEIEIADEDDCIAVYRAEVPVIGGLEVTLSEIVTPTCFNDNNGLIEVEASGGVQPFKFMTENQSNDTGAFTDLKAGVYNILVSDLYGCRGSIKVQLDDVAPIAIDTIFKRQPRCPGGNDGGINADADGGNGRLSYTLGSLTNFNGVFNNLSQGKYDLKIVDEKGCTNTFEVDLGAPAPLALSSLQLLSPSCFGYSDGAIIFNASGGTGKKNVTINGDVFNEEVEFTNIEAGIYTILLRDANSCNARFDIFMGQPQELIIDEVIVTPHTPNNLGSIEVQAIGGSKPLEYSLDGDIPQFNPLFTQLQKGMYQLLVEDAHHCQAEAMVEVPFDALDINPVGSITDIIIGQIPGSDETMVTLISHGNQEIIFHIFDMGGKFIGIEKSYAENGPNLIAIPTYQLPTGIYILRIASSRDVKTQRFLKY